MSKSAAAKQTQVNIEIGSQGVKHLIKNKKPGIYATVSGEYYAQSYNRALAMPYHVEFLICPQPDKILPSNQKLRAMIESKLLPHFFKSQFDKFPDFNGLRKCMLVDVERVHEARTERDEAVSDEDKHKQMSKLFRAAQSDDEREARDAITKMTLDELVRFVALEELDMRVDAHSTIFDARERAISLLEQRRLDKYKSKTQADTEDDEEFDELDELLAFAKSHITEK